MVINQQPWKENLEQDKKSSLSADTNNQLQSSQHQIIAVLENPNSIINILKQIEKTEKWFQYNSKTLESIFTKYPKLSEEEFIWYFLTGIYNKNILMCSPEIVSILNLDEINIWDDLVEYILKKISLSKADFENKVKWKLDILTFPNLAAWDVAQWYFYDKLQKILPETQIVFWDMPEIKANFWKNQFNCDSVWFIDLMWNGLFNTCLLKLLKTHPIPEKLEELNTLFSTIEKDIFIWWSTHNIPFKVPDSFLPISMPKWIQNWNPLNLLKHGMLLNSMWYLNSAYYAKKTKASFVMGSHNIAEPMHAGKLTVINDDPTNRYNHNWLISYFWEKAWLLHYMEWNHENNQKWIHDFLETSQEELQKRYDEFQRLYEQQIKPLIYWIFYNFLKKNFPENIQ